MDIESCWNLVDIAHSPRAKFARFLDVCCYCGWSSNSQNEPVKTGFHCFEWFTYVDVAYKNWSIFPALFSWSLVHLGLWFCNFYGFCGNFKGSQGPVNRSFNDGLVNPAALRCTRGLRGIKEPSTQRPIRDWPGPWWWGRELSGWSATGCARHWPRVTALLSVLWPRAVAAGPARIVQSNEGGCVQLRCDGRIASQKLKWISLQSCLSTKKPGGHWFKGSRFWRKR